MKLDPLTIRLLGRLTDRMDLIRKHPLRYDITPEDFAELRPAAERLEAMLEKIKVVKVG